MLRPEAVTAAAVCCSPGFITRQDVSLGPYECLCCPSWSILCSSFPLSPALQLLGFPPAFSTVVCSALLLAFLAHECSHVGLFGAHSYAAAVCVIRDTELALHHSKECSWHSDLQEESMLRWHKIAKHKGVTSIMGLRGS